MISGKYVDTFAEATHGMLDGVSLNAPYPFFWGKIKEVAPDHIVFIGDGEEMRLAISKRRGGGEQSVVTIQDPLFGPQRFPVLPFKGEES
jgi:hypothetical protein